MKKIILFLLFFFYFFFLDAASAKLQPNKSNTIVLKTVLQTLNVNGRKSKVFNIIRTDQNEGYVGTKGNDFDVLLKNETSVPVSIHWHGLILPNDQDGVPYVTQLPIPPGGSHHYHFKIVQAGTYWMHSHFQFHEQELMAAPLILKDPEMDTAKDVVVLFHDFTFKNPANILKDLQHPKKMMAMNMSHGKVDLNDVNYEAVLANRRTLQNPEIVQVKPDEKIRLRLINGASASNFWVNTGKLLGVAIAVDGAKILPIKNNQFQLAVAQRIDIEVTIPKMGGAFPILAQIEGTKKQTGIILATENAHIPKLSETANKLAPALNDQQELKLHAKNPLPQKPVTTTLNYKLSGDMQTYTWKINDEVWPHIKPLKINKGDRVAMIFKNDSGMAHPMHLHGHVFQVAEINGKPIQNGPMHDTILVLPHSTKTIIFDATNPGIWMMHCHVLYHMLSGMMTTTNYRNYPEPDYYRKLIGEK